jgi:hypothetical protein
MVTPSTVDEGTDSQKFAGLHEEHERGKWTFDPRTVARERFG